LAEQFWQSGNSCPDEFCLFSSIGNLGRGIARRGKQLEQRPRFALFIWCGNCIRRSVGDTSIAPAERINCLVRGNSIEPGSGGSSGFVLTNFQEDLEERVLEDIVRKVIIAKIPPEVAEQFPFVSPHEGAKYGLFSFPEPGEEVFVRLRG
jgi:hypothetical protein